MEARGMDIEAVLEKLERNDGVLPAAALCEAEENREAVTPRLLDILGQAVDDPSPLIRDRAAMIHVHAMFLLARFGEPRAFSLIRDFFARHGDTAIALTGDVVTEYLGQLLAMTASGSSEEIEALIEEPAAHPFVRGAAIEALLCLVAWDELDRGEAAGYLASLCAGRLERERSQVWNALAEAAARICTAETEKDFGLAYDEGLVDPLYLDRQTLADALASDPDGRFEALRRDPLFARLGSVAATMAEWACFKPADARRGGSLTVAPRSRPVERDAKVGRNEPCPCGSGRKYKKCCLGK